ncbi:MAG: protein kinase [Blastocatellia bacterium]|nr:protein kinase [Blastocatellia bacterium]MBN8722122.1 protein kinase [Acidobacteriota bacterium]
MSQAQAADPAIGTIIEDKYRIDSLMGKGGMGKVFKVTHLNLNKTFALKLMNFSSNVTDPNHLARFRREAEALAKIAHPNVVMVTDFGVTAEQVPYIVMEYIQGVSLRSLLEKMGKLPEKQAIQIAKQMCSGLHAAHTQGIVHRDLKPENIMVQQLNEEEIVTKVLDFGIAKLLVDDPSSQNLTSNEELLGTLKYMTPEQFLGTPVDARSDVFGICLIVYEMLAGIVPPAVMSLAQPLHELCPEISLRLSDIILKGLAQSPDQRQQSALALKKEIDNVEQDAMMDIIRDGTEDASGIYYNNTSNSTNRTGRTGRQNFNNTNQTQRHNTTASGKRQDNSIKPQQNLPPEDDYPEVISYEKPRTNPIVYVVVLVLLVAGGFGGWKYYQSKANTENTDTNNKVSATELPPMVKIKGDSFKMGRNSKIDLYSSPEHLVQLESFYVSSFLVTNHQYAVFIKNSNYPPPDNWRGQKTPPNDQLEKPVTTVRWQDAKAYCDWLTQQTGKAYRMPTEAEWEYLANNHASLNVKQMMEDNIEWTNSEFKAYPNSKAEKLGPGNFYIIRGLKEDGKMGKVDPIIYRFWEQPSFSFENLGFRIAYKAD